MTPPFTIGLVGPTGRPVLLDGMDLLTTSPTSRKAPAAARVSAESPMPVEASPAPPSVPERQRGRSRVV